MKQVFGVVLPTGLLAGLWLTLKVVQCHIFDLRPNVPYCYDTGSRRTCFATFFNGSIAVVARVPFEEATHQWCKVYVPASSLIVIDDLESETIVERFIGVKILQNETIITDARMVSADESQKWSWVNGYRYSSDVGPSKDVMDTAGQFHDAACVELKHGQSLTYCFDNVSSEMSFICSRYREESRYTANEGNATWHNARKKCLESGGDLASFHDLQTMENFTLLSENHKYWIGLHRNKWIWSSTGVALNYTNWENGFPDESPDKQCICLNPKCRSESGKSTPICEAENHRKWRTCNCNNSYAIVCQKEEKPFNPRFTTRVKTFIDTTPNGTATSTSKLTSNLQPIIPVTSDATTRPISYHITQVIDRTTTASTSLMTQEPSNNSLQQQTTNFAPPSKEQVDSFDTTWIFLIVLFVTVVIIIIAVILIIRKRKHDKRLEGSPMENVNQDETAANASLYATVVPGKSEVNTPAGNIIYAEVDMSQGPTPSNTIYASVQPTSGITQTIDMGKNVVYAELDLLENINKSQ